MDSNIFQLISTILGGIWSYFTDIHIPGFSAFTFADYFLFSFMMTLILAGLKIVGIGSTSGASSYRSGENGRAHFISSERKGDTK